jgi:hypothetical protein
MLNDLSRSVVRIACAIGLSAAFAVLAGCDDRSPTSPVLRRDQLELLRIVPAGGSRIPPGQRVRCEAVILELEAHPTGLADGIRRDREVENDHRFAPAGTSGRSLGSLGVGRRQLRGHGAVENDSTVEVPGGPR